MPIGDEKVEVSIVVVIEKAGAEADIEVTFFTEMCFVNHVRKRPIAVVPIKGIGLMREVGNEEIQKPIAIVIPCINAHARLCHAVKAISAARGQRDVCERAIPIVVKEVVWGIIVGDVEVWMAIIVEIGSDDAQTFPAKWPTNPTDT